MKQVWISGISRGEVKSYAPDGAVSGTMAWELKGVFETEQEAVASCTAINQFVAQCEFGVSFGDDPQEFPVVYYPLHPSMNKEQRYSVVA